MATETEYNEIVGLLFVQAWQAKKLNERYEATLKQMIAKQQASQEVSEPVPEAPKARGRTVGK